MIKNKSTKSKKMLLISGNVKGQSHVLGLSAPLSHLWMDFVAAQVCYYKAMQWWSWSYRSNTTHTQTHRGAISESDCIHKLHVKLRVFTMRCGPDFEAEDNTHSYSRDWSMIYFIFLFDSNGTIIHQVNNMFHQIKRATESIKSSGECLMRS